MSVEFVMLSYEASLTASHYFATPYFSFLAVVCERSEFHRLQILPREIGTGCASQ